MKSTLRFFSKMRQPMLAAVAVLTFMRGAVSSQSVLEDVARAMGAENLKSIQYSGSGYIYYLGQSFQPGDPWPKYKLKSYVYLADYEKRAYSEDQVWTQLGIPQRGGVIPFTGERRQRAFLSGDFAWDVGPDGAEISAPEVIKERQVQLAITPHGWVKAAMEASPTTRVVPIDGKKMTIVSFALNGKYRVNGYINGRHLLEKVETWLPNPVLGDMPVEITYTDYRDFEGVKFPTKIVEKQGGFPVLDLNVSEVRPNAPANIEIPDAARQPGPMTRVNSQKLADGVWFLAGGTHNSVAVELKDYVAVIEAPLNEERSLAVIAEVKKLAPNKPIWYLINTHHHFDHAGGLRTYVAEGATIITDKINKPFYEQVFQTPRTLSLDMLSQNQTRAKFVTVEDKYVLTDGVRRLEIYAIQGSPHDAGMLMAYLPKEKLLIEADVFIMPPPDGPIASAPSWTKNLEENIERLKLDVQQIAPIHGRVVPATELRKALARAE